jgi:hypothetical protein
MQRTLLIDALEATDTKQAADIPALTQRIISQLGDAQFAQAGIWQLSYVRIDLPLHIASAPKQAFERLQAWLSNQGLAYQITGAKRTSALLHLEFERYR